MRPHALDPPQTQFLIRPVRSTDADSLKSLFWQHRSDETIRLLLRYVLQCEQRGRGQGIVVQDENRIIAYGQVTQWGREAEISELIVLEAYRGYGVGTAMIQYLVNVARQIPVWRIAIGVMADNPRALALYERLGFTDRRTLTLPEQGDMYYLHLNLPDSDHI